MSNAQAILKNCITLEKEIDILTENINDAESRTNTLFYANKLKQERTLLVTELRGLKRKLTEIL